jgi:hypothetical protein
MSLAEDNFRATSLFYGEESRDLILAAKQTLGDRIAIFEFTTGRMRFRVECYDQDTLFDLKAEFQHI